MSKLTPQMRKPGSMKMPTKGGRNATTEQSRRGAGGMAPKPSGGAAMLGHDRPSAPVQASMARVNAGGQSPEAGSHMPVRNNAMRGLVGPHIGQMNPQTGAAATKKPKRKGIGSAFFGEY